MTILPALGSLLLMCSPILAASGTAEAEKYSIKMQIYDGKQLIGAPQLTATEGHLVTIETALPNGKGYTVAATLMRKSSSTVEIKSRVEIVSPDVRRSISSEMLLTLGASASFDQAGEGSAPMRVMFEVDREQTASVVR